METFCGDASKALADGNHAVRSRGRDNRAAAAAAAVHVALAVQAAWEAAAAAVVVLVPWADLLHSSRIMPAAAAVAAAQLAAAAEALAGCRVVRLGEMRGARAG